MKRVFQWIKRIFFPASNVPLGLRLLPYILLGVLTLLVLTAGAYAWDYTNSPEFCGQVCHTMPPEYTAYLTSPHARIACVDCHIGKGFIATRITRKAGDVKHVLATLFKTYEFPIHAKDLRPARETCERCHFPEKFSDDSLREIKHFAEDLNNTPTTIYLVLKTGGGSRRLGLGRGIHWHIENKVYYLPADEREQVIPYVRVVMEDGSVSEYFDIESDLKPEQINPSELKEMDCITCHNRITHLIYTPQATVEQLLERGLISPDIPEIRRKAVEVYEKLYDDVESGVNGIGGLVAYYQVNYPDCYAANSQKIEAVIRALQDAYRKSVFPEQKASWLSHPNNIGHKDSPGCFRCHDGKHLNANQEAIRLECNLCHSIPVVAGAQDFVANLEISRGPEPQSHLNPNWISMHHLVFDETCTNCHTTENPGGSDNTSFCSNSACHGSAWEYAGFDAPALRPVILAQLPPTPTPVALPTSESPTFEGGIDALFRARCGACHGATGSIQGLNLTSYQDALKGSSNGSVIIPGDAKNSLLIRKQTAEQPHFAQFTSQELQQVIAWIEAGAPEK